MEKEGERGRNTAINKGEFHGSKQFQRRGYEAREVVREVGVSV